MAAAYVNGALKAYTHESLTIDNTVGGVGVTAANLVTNLSTNAPYDKNVHCVEVYISAETAQMRYTLDGTAPEASVGHILEAGDTLVIQGYDNIRQFRAIRTGATSGTLRVTFFRQR